MVFATVETTNSLVVIDTATNKNVGTISLTGRPNLCAATPDGHYVVVPVHDRVDTDIMYGPWGSPTIRIPVADPGGIDIIDIPQREIVKVLPVKGPHNCFTAGSNDDMYCESRVDDTISHVDMKRLDYDHVIPVGGDPRPFAVSKDEKKMYVELTGFHGFAAINVSGSGAIQRVELPAAPPLSSSPCARVESALSHGIALTPDGKEVWVASLTDARVYVYDIASTKISGEVSTGACPVWIAISADGKYTAVTGAGNDDVSIIDTKTRKQIARINNVGKEPKRVLFVETQ
jgi:YVTN family beta-propeller protein